MNIKFIGVGSAFSTQEYYQPNMLITARSGKKLLLDCGSDARFALSECGIYNHNVGNIIDGVYISHLHADHIGGMEWLAFTTYFNPKAKRPKLFIEKNIIRGLWEHSLKGGLGCIDTQSMHLIDYFEDYPVDENGSFEWEGIKAKLVKMPHVINCYKCHYSFGLLIKEIGERTPLIFITTDTLVQPALLKKLAPTVDTIFHDCETLPFKTRVHAHYDELCELPREIKQKMWLYHYQPHPIQKPERDGFRGFVVKGQEFDF